MDEKRKKLRNAAIVMGISVYIVLTTVVLVAHRKNALESRRTAGPQEENSRKNGMPSPSPESGDDMESKKNPDLLYYRQGEISKTIEQYEANLRKRPHDPELHLALGRLYLGQSATKEKARAHFGRVLELEPNHPKRRIVELWMEQLK